MKRRSLTSLLSALMLLIVDPRIVISYDYDDAGNRISRTTLINSTPVQNSDEGECDGGEGSSDVETSKSEVQEKEEES